jgi:hypothetical protein
MWVPGVQSKVVCATNNEPLLADTCRYSIVSNLFLPCCLVKIQSRINKYSRLSTGYLTERDMPQATLILYLV